MFRKILRKMPWVYGIVRKLHIIFNDIVMFPLRCKINIETKKKISNLKIIDGNRVWYLCVPVHNNLGDYAQYVCISKWIKEAFPNYNEIEIPTIPLCYDYSGLEKEMKKKIKNDDVIIFQSGYTSSDLHPDEAVHRKIAKTFLKNKIVFFPQTVKYTSEKEIKKTAKLYNDHGRILFMTRDQQSFDEAKKYFTQIKVMLYPDIVTSLIGSFHKESLDKREGIVFCIRSDSEKLYTDSLIKREFEYLQSKKLTWLDTTLEKNKQCSKDIIDE